MGLFYANACFFKPNQTLLLPKSTFWFQQGQLFDGKAPNVKSNPSWTVPLHWAFCLDLSPLFSQGWVPCPGPSTQRSTLCGRGAQGTPAQPESTGPSTSWCPSPSSTWLSTSPTTVSFCTGDFTFRAFVFYVSGDKVGKVHQVHLFVIKCVTCSHPYPTSRAARR